jgi:hypothetical protein
MNPMIVVGLQCPADHLASPRRDRVVPPSVTDGDFREGADGEALFLSGFRSGCYLKVK